MNGTCADVLPWTNMVAILGILALVGWVIFLAFKQDGSIGARRFLDPPDPPTWTYTRERTRPAAKARKGSDGQ